MTPRVGEIHEDYLARKREYDKKVRDNFKFAGSAAIELKARRLLSIEDGVVVIASDAHYWPGDPSTAHRALIKIIKQLEPAAVIINGDTLDGASISRWGVGSEVEFRARPSVVEELAVCQQRMREIANAAPQAARYWPFGNHDARFETFLMRAAPEFAGVMGTRLKDHFDNWTPCWSVWINSDGPTPVVIKHRFRGGIHATYNNTLHSGLTMVTGHLHSLNVNAFSDYRGVRWGVDSGTLAVPYDRPFIHYTEDNPVNWRSGFVVLTFRHGRLLWPELVYVINEVDGLIGFRGEVLEV